jgi:competence protein ComEC
MWLRHVPRATWFAVGVTAGAAAGWAGAWPAVAIAVGLLTVGVGELVLPIGPTRRAIVATAFGAMLVAIRLAVAPAGDGLPRLSSAGAAPWTADVVAMSSPKDGSQYARLAIRASGPPVVVAATLPAFPAVTVGAVVAVEGQLEPPPAGDPYGDYLERTGASGSLQATNLRILRAPPWPSVQAVRDGAGDALRLAIPEPEAGLAAGILIGLRERVDRGLAADFATAGVSHVVAISGWNIAIVAALVGSLLRGRQRRAVGLATGGVIAAYVVAAGASPSVVRAAVMAGVVLVARASGRGVRAPAALSLAASGLLLLDPAMIEDAGFRLSVMATAGLLAWATPLGSWLGRLWGGRLPAWLAEGLGITLAAQAATLPDVLATFGRLSLVAPAANLLVVPIVPAAMAGGAIALLGGWLVLLGAPAPIGMLAGIPGWLLLRLMVSIVRFAAALPFAAVTLPTASTIPAAAASAALVAGALALVRWRARHRRTDVRQPPPATTPSGERAVRRAAGRKHRTRPATRLERIAIACAAIAVAVAALAATDTVGRPDRLVLLDVGQGDAILVESADGARMLVDGGPDPDRVLTQLDSVVPAWDRRIDIVVLTHPHEDHVAGLVRVLERYRVGRVFEPGMHGTGPGWDAWDAALRHGPPRAQLAAGARLTLGDIALEVRWPEPGAVTTAPGDTGRAINDVSIVLLGTAAGRHFLLTGDAEEDVDPALLAGGLPRLDVLKVAHHGSATATTAELLAATRPALALISVGAANDYGHPASSTLGRLREAGARVYRTDVDGQVEADLRPDRVDVHVSGSHGAAAMTPTGYDRSHDRPPTPRGSAPAALARAARLVPPSLLRRGRRGRPSRRAGVCPGEAAGPCRRGGGGTPARRRQVAGSRHGRPPPSR